MDTNQLASLTNRVRELPAQGARRDRRLHRLTDLYAAAEAESALRAAAARAGDDEGLLARVLVSASQAWDGGPEDAGPLSDDLAATERLHDSVSSTAFMSLMPDWVSELREVASGRPDTGACTLATALQLWSWTMVHFRTGQGRKSEWAFRAVDELAEALRPLLAARCLVLEVASQSEAAPTEAGPRADLCHVNAAHAAALTGAICAELVFGYRRHLVWDAEGCATCYGGDELDELEGLIPGIAVGAHAAGDVIEADGSHRAKAGPCARFDGVETFTGLRARLDGCLTGARLAKERAATALGHLAAGSDTTPAAATAEGQ